MSEPEALPGVQRVHVEVNGVQLVRGAQRVVFEALTLHITQARVGLIGLNGSGKSSFLRLIAGLERARRGQLDFLENGRSVAHEPRHTLVGMMFQNPDDQILFPTVEEEIALSFETQGHARPAARRCAQEFLQQQGLAHWSQRNTNSLSHGQRQYLCWMALQAARPRILLLDEPFASLDFVGQHHLCEKITQASQTVIIATHILEPIRQFERVIWFDQGGVYADGTGQEVCTRYEQDMRQRCEQHRPHIDKIA